MEKRRLRNGHRSCDLKPSLGSSDTLDVNSSKMAIRSCTWDVTNISCARLGARRPGRHLHWASHLTSLEFEYVIKV